MTKVLAKNPTLALLLTSLTFASGCADPMEELLALGDAGIIAIHGPDRPAICQRDRRQCLVLDELDSLSLVQAEALSTFRGQYIALNGLTSIGADAAAALAKWPGRVLSMNGLSEIDVTVAEALQKWRGKSLYLDGLSTFGAKTLKELIKFKVDHLSLNGVEEIPNSLAKSMAKWKGKRLSFNGVEKLKPRPARYLSDWSGPRAQPGWDYQNWCRSSGCSDNMGRQNANPSGHRALRRAYHSAHCQHPQLFVTSPEFHQSTYGGTLLCGGCLGPWECIAPKSSFHRRKGRSLHQQVASKNLYLDGLVELEPSAARALIKWPGKKLSLGALRSVPAGTARA